jgi:hypothetical protein
MLCIVCILAVSVWWPRGLLYLDEFFLLKIWELLYYNFVEYVSYVVDLHAFTFFNAYDLFVWSFSGVTEVFHIPFTFLNSFSQVLSAL